MAQNETNEVNPQEIKVKWFGNEKAFSIGARPVKIWELIVGLIVISVKVLGDPRELVIACPVTAPSTPPTAAATPREEVI